MFSLLGISLDGERLKFNLTLFFPFQNMNLCFRANINRWSQNHANLKKELFILKK